MLTGMLAVRNLVLGQHNDLWSVNTDLEYLEELSPDRGVTAQEAEQAVEGALTRVFAKLDRVAFGLSLGAALGALLLFATLALVLKGGEIVGPHLQLLSQYFPGYRVSMAGSVLGLAYGFVAGFIAGWGFASLRNATMFLYMAFVHRRAELRLIRRLLEFL
jgi:hypothetical protein